MKYMKTKVCPKCNISHSVMYRIQEEKGKHWIFVCKNCLPKSQKKINYRYGGTWKGSRH